MALSEDQGLTGLTQGVPERFVPEEMRGQLIEAEHMSRYIWSTQFCAGKRVLDAGCGIGYGTEMLLRAGAADVVGVDVAKAIVWAARARAPNVSFEVADLASLHYQAGHFDLIVCFEAIEHVSDQRLVLDELARVLAPEGLLLVSSPNRARYVPGNPHHRREYLPQELREVLLERFGAVALLQQHVMIASVLSHSGQTAAEGPTVKSFAAPGLEDETYIVAMAGRSLPEAGRGVVGLAEFAETRQLIEYISEQKRLIEAQQLELRSLWEADAARVEAVRRLADHEQVAAEIPVLRNRAQSAERGLELAAADLCVLRERLALAERSLADLRGSRFVRGSEPLRRAKRAILRVFD